MRKIGVVGMGLPGFRIGEAEVRRGRRVVVWDFKAVTARTPARVHGLADIGTPKVAAAARAARDLPRGAELLEAVEGRVEETIGGRDLRGGFESLFLAADRPSCVKRMTEMLLRVATAEAPVRLVTVNTGPRAAQVRMFRFPPADRPCAFCGTGDAYYAAAHRDLSVPCDGEVGEEGDRFTVPFDLAEGLAAAGLALSIGEADAGADVTLALAWPPQLFVSRVRKDPGCRLNCGAVEPWPAATATISHQAALGEAISEVAVEHGIEPRGATVEFLRPIGLGVECECGRRARPTMLRAGCEECRVPTVPVRGWTRVLSLEALRDEAGTSAASMGLPAPELMLLAGESGRRATIGTESGGG